MLQLYEFIGCQAVKIAILCIVSFFFELSRRYPENEFHSTMLFLKRPVSYKHRGMRKQLCFGQYQVVNLADNLEFASQILMVPSRRKIHKIVTKKRTFQI